MRLFILLALGLLLFAAFCIATFLQEPAEEFEEKAVKGWAACKAYHQVKNNEFETEKEWQEIYGLQYACIKYIAEAGNN